MALPQNFTLELVEDVNGNYGSVAVPWPLLSQYRMPAAKMPMRLVYPRPDGEAGAHARHRWAYQNMLYEIPIGIQGGNWPFKYELITAPTGAAIGIYYDRTKRGLTNEYGVVKWTPSASSGSNTFTVRVTDSDGSTVDVTWTVTIDATKFIFVDSNVATSGTGTIASPLKLLSDWYKNNVNDATYLNKIIVFRQGTYTLVGDTANGNPNLFLNSTTKTPSLMGYPGEVATIDYTSGKIQTSTAMPEMFVYNLRHINARQDVANAHYFYFTNRCDRSTFFKNHFDGMGYGTAGTDNAGPIFWADLADGVHHQNISIKDNLFEAINTHNGGLGNGHYWDIYQGDYVIAEGNVSKDSYTTYGHWPKAASSFVTIRNNDAFDNCQGAGAVIGYSDANDTIPHDHEVCWNNFQVPTAQGSPVFEVAMDDGWLGQFYNTFVYKNTFVGGYVLVRFAGAENYEFDANVILTNNLVNYNTSLITAAIASYISTSPANFNASGYPKDTTTWFYSGHQVN
jgi:hypothetical protein